VSHDGSQARRDTPDRDFLRRVFGVFDRYGISPHAVATSVVSIAVAIWEPTPLPQLTKERGIFGQGFPAGSSRMRRAAFSSTASRL
jgi:hypothetical protein